VNRRVVVKNSDFFAVITIWGYSIIFVFSLFLLFIICYLHYLNQINHVARFYSLFNMVLYFIFIATTEKVIAVQRQCAFYWSTLYIGGWRECKCRQHWTYTSAYSL